MFSKKINRTFSLVMAIVMAVSMFACCAVTASAEDATSPYAGYTWSPMRGVGTVAGETTNTTETITDMSLAEAQALKATEYSIESVENEDGTVTGIKVTTTNTVTPNDDGETATVVKKIKKEATIIDNPTVVNGDAFKFGIYSDRQNDTKGYHYVSKLNPWVIYSANNYANGFSIPGSGNLTLNNQHTITLEEDVLNVKNSFYLTMSQIDDMKNVVIFRVQQYNEMALSFVAPEDGVYSAVGLISKVRTAGNAEAEGIVNYYLAKIDINGVEHAVTEKANVPTHASGATSIPNNKVELKAGEMLVVRTDNDVNYVGKVFLENFLVTKWEYSVAEDKTSITTKYNYKNNNFMSIYGENYDITKDNNFAPLWTAEAVRFSLDRTQVLDTIPFDGLHTTDSMVRAYVKNSAFTSQVRQDYGAAITYKSDGTIWAKADIRPLNGENFRYGSRFTFTVPEDGNIELIGGLDNGSNIFVERVGIIKAGSAEIEYIKYHSYAGNKVEWIGCKHSADQLYRIYKLGDFKAGDKIVYELTHTYANPSNNFERVRLDHLSVNITTSNTYADITGDFKADATDVSYMRKFVISKIATLTDEAVFDITGDGVSDLKDLVRIKRVLAGDETVQTPVIPETPKVEDAPAAPEA